MAFENITDKIKEQFIDIWDKVQESSLYNNLREKFETQSVTTQRGIVFGSVVLLLLFVLSFPYSYFNSSSAFNEEYNENKNMLRSLLRASRLASEATYAPPSVSSEEVKSQIQNMLPRFTLLPEQVGSILDIDMKAMGESLAPKNVGQNGIGLSLKKLNLKQVVDIGFEIQKLNQSVKLVGLDIVANVSDNHYFDVLYKLIIFSVPKDNASFNKSKTEKSKMIEKKSAEDDAGD
ncbi:MAG: hypothetical protein A2Z20_07055 [Bdellovibrionales bacterium RBG_16_40_8]|nr:MAG: hypothetical protein A2Z20_07055 [Bdellovibrionales bacterium RBG_16_40_8]